VVVVEEEEEEEEEEEGWDKMRLEVCCGQQKTM